MCIAHSLSREECVLLMRSRGTRAWSMQLPGSCRIERRPVSQCHLLAKSVCNLLPKLKPALTACDLLCLVRFSSRRPDVACMSSKLATKRCMNAHGAPPLTQTLPIVSKLVRNHGGSGALGALLGREAFTWLDCHLQVTGPVTHYISIHCNLMAVLLMLMDLAAFDAFISDMHTAQLHANNALEHSTEAALCHNCWNAFFVCCTILKLQEHICNHAPVAAAGRC